MIVKFIKGTLYNRMQLMTFVNVMEVVSSCSFSSGRPIIYEFNCGAELTELISMR